MDELRDIKPFWSYSEWLYWGLIALGIITILVIIGIIWWGTSRWLHNKKHNIRMQYLQAIKSVDWSNPKSAAYSVSHYGRLLAKDARSLEILSQLEPMLLEYKYKKDVPSANDETLAHYHLLIQVLDV